MNKTISQLKSSHSIVDQHGELSNWASDLIYARLHDRGVPQCCVGQYYGHIVSELLGYAQRHEVRNGAKLSTAVINVIDRQILHLQRDVMRRRNYEQGYAKAQALREPDHCVRRDGGSESDRQQNMQMDIKDVLASMDAEQQRICVLLSQGFSERAIARELGVSLYRIYKQVIAIRGIMKDAGLDAWMNE